jgi:hypothetical protein
VHQDVNRSELVADAADEVCDLGVAGEIGTVDEGARGCARDLPGDVIQRLHSAAGQAHPRSFCAEGKRHSATDAAAGSGDHGRLTGQG